MKKLKLAAVIIAAVLCLQSCGIIVINNTNGKMTDSTAPDVTDTAEETKEVKEIVIDKTASDDLKKKADEVLNGLDTIKFSGMRILVAATDTTFYEGDGSAALLTSDRVTRAEKVCEKLDANVDVVQYSADELYKKLKASVKNKEYFADVLAVPVSLVGQLASDGLIQSLRTIPGFDLGAEYFDKDSISAFSGGHGLYAISGDGCFEPEKTYCIYFNKDMAKQLGIDFYSLVSEGKWTLEKYVECMSAAESAGFGTVVMRNAKKYKQMLLNGSGFDFIEGGIDKVPQANTFTEEYESRVNLLAALPQAKETASVSEEFLSGNELFCIDTVFAAEKMADSSLVWGMLPFPKYNEQEEYGSYISDDAIVLCVPKYAADDKLSGDFIECLNAASSEYLKYDYLYHNMLDVLRDNGSVTSLNYILKKPNYDFGVAMSSGYPVIKTNTAAAFEELLSGSLTFEKYKGRETEVSEYMKKWFPVIYK